MNFYCAGAASELHRSFAAKDAAQDDIARDYSKNRRALHV
jgi:hypothetical protein